jgi:hypothetical protein
MEVVMAAIIMEKAKLMCKWERMKLMKMMLIEHKIFLI